MSKILSAAEYTFVPAQRQIVFATASFDIRKLQLIEHAPSGTLLYAGASPGIGYTAVVGPTLTINYDTTGMNADDPLRIYYGDDLFSLTNPGHVTLEAQNAGLATEAGLDTANVALAAIEVGVGAPDDADPGSDSAAASIVALLRRGLGRWSTLLASLVAPGAAATAAHAVQGVSGGVPLAVSGTISSNPSTVTADTSGTLAAGATASIAANPLRQMLVISNTGPNPLSYRFGGTASALNGHTLSPGDTVPFDTKVPTAAISLFSTGGTSFFVTTG